MLTLYTRPPVTSLHTYFREILGTRKKITRLVNYAFQKVRLEKLVKLVFQEFRVISLEFPENIVLLVVRARRAPVYRHACTCISDFPPNSPKKSLHIKKNSRCAAYKSKENL